VKEKETKRNSKIIPSTNTPKFATRQIQPYAYGLKSDEGIVDEGNSKIISSTNTPKFATRQIQPYAYGLKSDEGTVDEGIVKHLHS
jgi:hypothetical protein